MGVLCMLRRFLQTSTSTCASRCAGLNVPSMAAAAPGNAVLAAVQQVQRLVNAVRGALPQHPVLQLQQALNAAANLPANPQRWLRQHFLDAQRLLNGLAIVIQLLRQHFAAAPGLAPNQQQGLLAALQAFLAAVAALKTQAGQLQGFMSEADDGAS